MKLKCKLRRLCLFGVAAGAFAAFGDPYQYIVSGDPEAMEVAAKSHCRAAVSEDALTVGTLWRSSAGAALDAIFFSRLVAPWSQILYSTDKEGFVITVF